jgi:hypothetical protein
MANLWVLQSISKAPLTITLRHLLPDPTARFLTTAAQLLQHKINLGSDHNKTLILLFFLRQYQASHHTRDLRTPAAKPSKMTFACHPLHQLALRLQQRITRPGLQHRHTRTYNLPNKAAYLQCLVPPLPVQVLAVKEADPTR